MNPKRVFFLLPKVLFVVIILLFGCSTAKKKPVIQDVAKKEVKKTLLDELLVFKDLQQIDLDSDGIKEIIGVYSTPTIYTTGVVVIKIRGTGQKEILYKKIFNTPNVSLKIVRGLPNIIVVDKDSNTGCGFSRVYRWDGKNFVEKSCVVF